MSEFVSLEQAGFSVETDAGREQLRAPAQGPLFVACLMTFWLFVWTLIGLSALGKFARDPNIVLLFYFAFWAIVWCGFALTVAWRFFGMELLRPSRDELEIERRVLGYRQVKRYRAGEIRQLTVYTPAAYFLRFVSLGGPFFLSERWGSATFEYGARSIYLVGGYDKAEARRIVEWLAARLPPSAAAR